MNTFVAELKKEHENHLKAQDKAFAKEQAKKQQAFMKSQQRQANAKRMENSPLRNEDFHYTDASKYAKKYYGETFHETTRFDNDWN
jgi:predicted S18 family serine protease